MEVEIVKKKIQKNSQFSLHFSPCFARYLSLHNKFLQEEKKFFTQKIPKQGFVASLADIPAVNLSIDIFNIFRNSFS